VFQKYIKMEFLLLALAFLFLLGGLLGAIIPGIPGPPLSFIGILLVGSIDAIAFKSSFYITIAIVAIVIILIDYYFPIYGTKLMGGTKAGIRGSTIGLVVALFVLPFIGIVLGPFGITGIIIGPFAGAYVGEKLAGTPDEKAWKSAFGSFMGFVAGTFIKIAYAVILIIIAIKELITWMLN